MSRAFIQVLFLWISVARTCCCSKSLLEPQGCPNILLITSFCSPIFPSKLVFKCWDIIYMIRYSSPNNYLMFWMVNFAASNIFIFWAIYFHIAAIWDKKFVFLIPIWFKAWFMIICLVSGRANIVLQVQNTWQPSLPSQDSFPSHYSSPRLTYMGFTHHHITFHLNLPRVTKIPLLWWFHHH